MSVLSAPARLAVLVALSVLLFLGTFSSSGRSPDVLSAGGAASMAGGGSQSCAVTEAGAVKCWGWNFYGQLGDGTTASRAAPADVCGDESCESVLSGIAKVASGDTHTCALSDAGGVWCWGQNDDGWLGDGTVVERHTPTSVCAPVAQSAQCGALGDIVDISAGHEVTCAVTASGRVYCWGANGQGQLGDGTGIDSARPVAACEPGSPTSPCAPLSDIVDISVGWRFVCAVGSGGAVACWGHNGHGQLGDGQACDVDWCGVPTQAAVSDAVSIGTGNAHACVVTSDANVRCWGENFHGQLGDGTNTPRSTPVDVCVEGAPGCASGLPDVDAVAVATGHSHTCVLLANGEIWCWGDNHTRQLGDGTTNNSPLPVRVEGVGEAAQLAAGGSHTCAVSPSGGMRCWGFNGDGRLGDGGIGTRVTPVDVLGFGGEKPPTATPTSTPTLTSTPTNTPTATAQTLLGDANCDGDVTSVDAALILQLVAALVGSLPCGPQADLNGDGAVTAVDAALVLQTVAGLL